MWDLDGNMYYDMSYNGIAACILGAADPEVEEAVIAAVRAGSMSTLNPPEEVELADLLCELHPWADMVRYGRCGGEAMAMAVRIARRTAAATGWRSAAITAGTTGTWPPTWPKITPWTATFSPASNPPGVPRALMGTALPFRYNHAEELEAIVAKHGSEIGTVVMEPIRNMEPVPGFLAQVRAICDRIGAVLVVDEVSVGWRLITGGAHLVYGLQPDIAVFAKAISNGYPMAAIIGKREVMQSAQKPSSAAPIGPSTWPGAALATIKQASARERAPAPGPHRQMVRDGWRLAASGPACQLRSAAWSRSAASPSGARTRRPRLRSSPSSCWRRASWRPRRSTRPLRTRTR